MPILAARYENILNTWIPKTKSNNAMENQAKLTFVAIIS